MDLPPKEKPIQDSILRNIADRDKYCYRVTKYAEQWEFHDNAISIYFNKETLSQVAKNHLDILRACIAHAAAVAGVSNPSVELVCRESYSCPVAFNYPPPLDNLDAPGVYCLRNTHGIKVGKSTRDASERAQAQLVPGMVLEWVVRSLYPSGLERRVHDFMNTRAHPIMGNEWWDCSKFSSAELMTAATRMEEV